MPKPIVPVDDLGFATNPNYTGGGPPFQGTPTKSEPSTGRKADGWRPAEEPPAQEWNWWWHWIADWVRFFYNEMLSPLITDAGVLKADTVDSPQIVDKAVTRIHLSEGVNLLINSTGTRGLQFFPGSDWTPEPYTDNNGNGPEWTNTSDDGSNNSHSSIFISPVTNGINFTLSFQLNVAIVNRAAGQVSIQLQDYTAGGVFISNFAQLVFTTDQLGYQTFEVTGVTSATTGQIRFSALNTLTADSVSISLRRIKVEKGTKATTYSDESSMIPDTFAGDGLVEDSDGNLEVNVDDSTIEIDTDVVQVKDDGITDAKLRNSAALSVIGRAGNSVDDPADIAAGSDGQVLRRSGTSLGFGQIVSAGITNGAVVSGKIDSSVAGDGLGLSAGALEVRTDDSTIEIVGDVLQVVDGGIDESKVSGAVARWVSGGQVKNDGTSLGLTNECRVGNITYLGVGAFSGSHSDFEVRKVAAPVSYQIQPPTGKVCADYTITVCSRLGSVILGAITANVAPRWDISFVDSSHAVAIADWWFCILEIT